jgi:divalent metal cation (Fe/Co/Zn/Cd) transporter
VIASVAAIVAGAPILDPIIGLGMTAVILRITRESWRTVRGHSHHA